MASDHQRNLLGMYAAPRCQAISSHNAPCLSPAVRGKTRCHVHGGKGSKGKSQADKGGDYSKATLMRDRQTSAEIKRLDRSLRKLRRKGAPAEVIADLELVRRNLLTMTQQREADLAGAYTSTEKDWEAAQNEAAVRAYTSKYLAGGDQTPEMLRDRAMGAMHGLAVGEAIGVTLDGWDRDSYREIDEMHGGGEFELKPGQWAGNTAMALAFMESLTWRRGLDETDFMERLLEWQEEGIFSCTRTCIGIGPTTSKALATYKETGDPIAGNRHPDSLTSGSLVRLAPVAIRYWNDRVTLRDVAARQSRTTHAGPAQVDACVAFAEVLRDAISGAPRSIVLGERYVPSASWVDFIMSGSWKNKPRDAIRSDGSVLSALETAMWCVDRSETFDEAVLLAANLGEDAARTAALAGQLAGAFYGACTIRPSWLQRVARRDLITDRVDALFKQSQPRKRPSG